MPKSKIFTISLQILIILAIVYVGQKVSFLFTPIMVFFSTLFIPVLISGFLYFLFMPIIMFLEKLRLSRGMAILVLYVLIISIIGLALGTVVPMLGTQLNDLFHNFPAYVNALKDYIHTLKWIPEGTIESLNLIDLINKYSNEIQKQVQTNANALFGVVSNAAVIMMTVPVLLFYMLKDGHLFPDTLLKLVPKRYTEEGQNILKETRATVSSYIQSQVIVCLLVGVCATIGYAIIGIPNALLLGTINAFTNIIPYFGPFIGAVPAVIVGFFVSPTTALMSIVVILIIQQLEGNVISPMIMSKTISTHPATIILLMLVVGNLYGILGMVLAVPTYAVGKLLVKNISRIIELRKRTDI